MGYCAHTPARSPGPYYMQGPEKKTKKNVNFFFKKKVKKMAQHPQSQPVCTDRLQPAASGRRPGDGWSTADRRSPAGRPMPDRRSPVPGDPRSPTAGRSAVGRSDQRSATAPVRVPHFVHPLPPLPNLLAHKILHMRSTLPHWLQHMPALPRLLLETSNIHNF
jgi:hypothetical protein